MNPEEILTDIFCYCAVMEVIVHAPVEKMETRELLKLVGFLNAIKLKLDQNGVTIEGLNQIN